MKTTQWSARLLNDGTPMALSLFNHLGPNRYVCHMFVTVSNRVYVWLGGNGLVPRERKPNWMQTACHIDC